MQFDGIPLFPIGTHGLPVLKSDSGHNLTLRSSSPVELDLLATGPECLSWSCLKPSPGQVFVSWIPHWMLISDHFHGISQGEFWSTMLFFGAFPSLRLRMPWCFPRPRVFVFSVQTHGLLLRVLTCTGYPQNGTKLGMNLFSNFKTMIPYLWGDDKPDKSACQDVFKPFGMKTICQIWLAPLPVLYESNSRDANTQMK